MIKRILQLLLILCLPFILSFCEKPDKSAEDFINYNWKLYSIGSGTETVILTDYNFHRNEAFILRFMNDSLFQLNTSVNYAEGYYLLSNSDSIIFYDYSELTEVGEMDFSIRELNNMLIEFMNDTHKLIIDGDLIILQKESKEITFNRY